jgi:FAD/FMN-containing dehydrogenase
VACQTFAKVQETLKFAKETLGEILAAFEFMDKDVLDVVAEGNARIPISAGNGQIYPYCVLIETQGSSEEHDMTKMEDFLERSMETGVVIDGVLAQDRSQVEQMWELRDSCNPAVNSKGYIYKYDLSMPISDFDDLIAEMRQRLSDHPTALVVNWGHVIDGNLHFNVVTPGIFDKDEALLEQIEPFIFESVVRRGGSISAEHGLGQCKNNYLPVVKDHTTLELMTSVKNLFDPNRIMNPGKYLPVIR